MVIIGVLIALALFFGLFDVINYVLGAIMDLIFGKEDN